MDDRSRSGSSERAAREYEEAWGHPGTRRGIRSGRRARARRDAYLRRASEAQAVDPLSVPVQHSGGQSRPLYTTRFWEPSDSEVEEEQAEGEPEVVVLEHTGAIDLTALGVEYLGPRSRLYTPPTSKASPSVRPTSVPVKASSPASSSSSSSRAVAKASPQIGASEQKKILDPLRYWYPPPGAADSDASQEPKRPGRIAGSLGHPFPNNAVAYLWKEKSFLKKVAGDLFHWGDTPLIALDYHQVLHIDRGVKPPVEVDEFGNLPPRHIQTVKHLRSVIEELKADVKIVIVSHIESSSRNERNLLTAVQQSLLPVDLVIVTRQRVGNQGKLAALKALTTSQFILADDNPSILQEIQEARQIALQIRKPKQRAILEWDFVTWSLSESWVVDRLEKFIRHHSK